jgi:hypothetical protein
MSSIDPTTSSSGSNGQSSPKRKTPSPTTDKAKRSRTMDVPVVGFPVSDSELSSDEYKLSDEDVPASDLTDDEPPSESKCSEDSKSPADESSQQQRLKRFTKTKPKSKTLVNDPEIRAVCDRFKRGYRNRRTVDVRCGKIKYRVGRKVKLTLETKPSSAASTTKVARREMDLLEPTEQDFDWFRDNGPASFLTEFEATQMLAHLFGPNAYKYECVPEQVNYYRSAEGCTLRSNSRNIAATTLADTANLDAAVVGILVMWSNTGFTGGKISIPELYLSTDDPLRATDADSLSDGSDDSLNLCDDCPVDSDGPPVIEPGLSRHYRRHPENAPPRPEGFDGPQLAFVYFSQQFTPELSELTSGQRIVLVWHVKRRPERACVIQATPTKIQTSRIVDLLREKMDENILLDRYALTSKLQHCIERSFPTRRVYYDLDELGEKCDLSIDEVYSDLDTSNGCLQWSGEQRVRGHLFGPSRPRKVFRETYDAYDENVSEHTNTVEYTEALLLNPK